MNVTYRYAGKDRYTMHPILFLLSSSNFSRCSKYFVKISFDHPHGVTGFLSTLFFTMMLPWATCLAGSHELDSRHSHKPSTFILAVGCCVPYLNPEPEICARGAGSLAGLFMDRLGVPEKNTRVLINDQATYKNVTGGLLWLSKVAGPKDTVVFYYNGHGMLMEDDDGDEKQEMDEVFVLWSEEEPFSVMYAVASNLWLVDDDLGSLIRGLRPRKVIIIADTCHASEAERGLYRRGAVIDYHQGDAALLASAQGDQVSFFDRDAGLGLFTEELLRAIRMGRPTLKDAFLEARQEVMRRWPACAERIGMSAYSSGQTPTLTDPLDVTPHIFFVKP